MKKNQGYRKYLIAILISGIFFVNTNLPAFAEDASTDTVSLPPPAAVLAEQVTTQSDSASQTNTKFREETKLRKQERIERMLTRLQARKEKLVAEKAPKAKISMVDARIQHLQNRLEKLDAKQ